MKPGNLCLQGAKSGEESKDEDVTFQNALPIPAGRFLARPDDRKEFELWQDISLPRSP